MAIRQSRRKFEKRLVENIKNDTKFFFAYARGNSKIRSRIGPLTNDEGHTTGSALEIAGEFNKYFASVFTKEDLDYVP